ncbi:MAG TPA: DUF4214 domain-containing protein [Iamia sp.]|nr:DUF4214 domain-containing protein [Iamia sp.]
MSTHTTTVNHPSIARRVGLLALGLLVVLTGIGLGATPASATAPTKPVKIFAIGYDDFVRVYWAPPTHGDPVTSYRIERFVQGQDQPQKAWTQSTTAPLVDTTAVDGVTYVYRVRASNADGHSPWGDDNVAWIDEFHTEHSRFGTDVGAFVTRQYQDFLGRNPGVGEKQTAVLNITNGTWSTGTLIANLVNKPERAHRHQVIRLYNAYFNRTADHGGLVFWSDQITEHGKSINTVSSSFAGSAEFDQMYGDLTNAQYVTLVYQNVLGRTPKPADLAYWKGRLDAKEISRGRMMTLFSESAEFKVLSRGRVLAADVHDAMLGSTIQPATLATWGRHIQGGGNAGDYGTAVMLLNAY